MQVLVGVDGSDRSLAALEDTAGRVREAGDTLTVALVTEAEEASEDDIDRVTETLDAAGVDADIERLEGDPGSRLVQFADGGEYDRLVVRGGTRTPMGKMQLDGTLQFILLNTDTTVVLYR
jgi:nucleotide-binding universal stress UspA family protein